ncbi:hypothetical protein CcCBS67573_g00232 [Chytriomyces confervae]|uniref:Uncharacterized protein n=1 Tax=Chytriomyces confervae TaxID=246404 RepID=A0A507FTF9_9FUNG|nr:hypothetical protein HDU80_006029 [Chytriomyces hyalinus]TPX78528.1 hypothetical protein CcCBS67573_g00232 [Chytriomyces confervae]
MKIKQETISTDGSKDKLEPNWRKRTNYTHMDNNNEGALEPLQKLIQPKLAVVIGSLCRIRSCGGIDGASWALGINALVLRNWLFAEHPSGTLPACKNTSNKFVVPGDAEPESEYASYCVHPSTTCQQDDLDKNTQMANNSNNQCNNFNTASSCKNSLRDSDGFGSDWEECAFAARLLPTHIRAVIAGLPVPFAAFCDPPGTLGAISLSHFTYLTGVSCDGGVAIADALVDPTLGHVTVRVSVAANLQDSKSQMHHIRIYLSTLPRAILLPKLHNLLAAIKPAATPLLPLEVARQYLVNILPVFLEPTPIDKQSGRKRSAFSLRDQSELMDCLRSLFMQLPPILNTSDPSILSRLDAEFLSLLNMTSWIALPLYGGIKMLTITILYNEIYRLLLQFASQTESLQISPPPTSSSLHSDMTNCQSCTQLPSAQTQEPAQPSPLDRLALFLPPSLSTLPLSMLDMRTLKNHFVTHSGIQLTSLRFLETAFECIVQGLSTLKSLDSKMKLSRHQAVNGAHGCGGDVNSARSAGPLVEGLGSMRVGAMLDGGNAGGGAGLGDQENGGFQQNCLNATWPESERGSCSSSSRESCFTGAEEAKNGGEGTEIQGCESIGEFIDFEDDEDIGERMVDAYLVWEGNEDEAVMDTDAEGLLGSATYSSEVSMTDGTAGLLENLDAENLFVYSPSLSVFGDGFPQEECQDPMECRKKQPLVKPQSNCHQSGDNQLAEIFSMSSCNSTLNEQPAAFGGPYLTAKYPTPQETPHMKDIKQMVLKSVCDHGIMFVSALFDLPVLKVRSWCFDANEMGKFMKLGSLDSLIQKPNVNASDPAATVYSLYYTVDAQKEVTGVSHFQLERNNSVSALFAVRCFDGTSSSEQASAPFEIVYIRTYVATMDLRAFCEFRQDERGVTKFEFGKCAAQIRASLPTENVLAFVHSLAFDVLTTAFRNLDSLPGLDGSCGGGGVGGGCQSASVLGALYQNLLAQFLESIGEHEDFSVLIHDLMTFVNQAI